MFKQLAEWYYEDMRWSRLKLLAEERLAKGLKGRITFNSARYGNCTCGRFWISVDGVELANLCTRAYYNRTEHEQKGASEESLRKFSKMPVEYGEFSRQQAYEAIWEFVHDLSIEDALASPNPLHQMFAVIDSRLGKRRLDAIDPDALHPLARALLLFRLGHDEANSKTSPEPQSL